jgi:hypothetical protein
MSGKLLDTTVLIDLFRGNEKAADFIEKARNSKIPLFISVDVGWVGTKWKPTIFQRTDTPFVFFAFILTIFNSSFGVQNGQ